MTTAQQIVQAQRDNLDNILSMIRSQGGGGSVIDDQSSAGDSIFKQPLDSQRSELIP